MNFDNDNSRKKKWGLLVTGVVGGTLVALYAVATPFITPALRKICLPFVPATSTQIENVLKMLQCRNGSLVDIGSGDGRIVSALNPLSFVHDILLNPLSFVHDIMLQPCPPQP